MLRDPEPFGPWLRRVREESGISMRRLAADLGVSHVYILEVERDRRPPLGKHHWDRLMHIIPSIDRESLILNSAFSRVLRARLLEPLSEHERMEVAWMIWRARHAEAK